MPLVWVGLEIGEAEGVVVDAAVDLHLDGACRAGESAMQGQVHPAAFGWPPRLLNVSARVSRSPELPATVVPRSWAVTIESPWLVVTVSDTGSGRSWSAKCPASRAAAWAKRNRLLACNVLSVAASLGYTRCAIRVNVFNQRVTLMVCAMANGLA